MLDFRRTVCIEMDTGRRGGGGLKWRFPVIHPYRDDASGQGIISKASGHIVGSIHVVTWGTYFLQNHKHTQ